jgi:hypothetical protein
MQCVKSSPSPVCVNANIFSLLRSVGRVILFAAACFLAACDRVEDPTHPFHPPPNAYVVPPGVEIAPGASLESFRSMGLYPESGENVQFCCFVGPRVTLPVLKRSGARALQIVLYVPKWKIFQRRPQGMEIAVGLASDNLTLLGVREGLRPGLHAVRLPLTSSSMLSAGEVPFFVRMRALVSAIPEREKVSADRRALGFVLVAVRFV